MLAKNDSVGKTIIVAFILCLICSVFVSSAAVFLKPAQSVNEIANMQMNILSAAGIYNSKQPLDDQFKKVTTKLVKLSTGEYDFEVDPSSYNQRKASKDSSKSRVLNKSEDIASIKRQANIAKVYLTHNSDGSIEKIILPIHGYGLWSTLYGFIAIEGDGNTVSGLGFYEHAETPGLGGEVDNPIWKNQWIGKQIYSEDKVVIRLIKGGYNMDDHHSIDALSGASLTSRGVNNMVQFWLSDSGFKPFLDKLKEGKI